MDVDQDLGLKDLKALFKFSLKIPESSKLLDAPIGIFKHYLEGENDYELNMIDYYTNFNSESISQILNIKAIPEECFSQNTQQDSNQIYNILKLISSYLTQKELKTKIQRLGKAYQVLYFKLQLEEFTLKPANFLQYIILANFAFQTDSVLKHIDLSQVQFPFNKRLSYFDMEFLDKVISMKYIESLKVGPLILDVRFWNLLKYKPAQMFSSLRILHLGRPSQTFPLQSFIDFIAVQTTQLEELGIALVERKPLLLLDLLLDRCLKFQRLVLLESSKTLSLSAMISLTSQVIQRLKILRFENAEKFLAIDDPIAKSKVLQEFALCYQNLQTFPSDRDFIIQTNLYKVEFQNIHFKDSKRFEPFLNQCSQLSVLNLKIQIDSLQLKDLYYLTEVSVDLFNPKSILTIVNSPNIEKLYVKNLIKLQHSNKKLKSVTYILQQYNEDVILQDLFTIEKKFLSLIGLNYQKEYPVVDDSAIENVEVQSLYKQEIIISPHLKKVKVHNIGEKLSLVHSTYAEELFLKKFISFEHFNTRLAAPKNPLKNCKQLTIELGLSVTSLPQLLIMVPQALYISLKVKVPPGCKDEISISHETMQTFILETNQLQDISIKKLNINCNSLRKLELIGLDSANILKIQCQSLQKFKSKGLRQLKQVFINFASQMTKISLKNCIIDYDFLLCSSKEDVFSEGNSNKNIPKFYFKEGSESIQKFYLEGVDLQRDNQSVTLELNVDGQNNNLDMDLISKLINYM